MNHCEMTIVEGGRGTLVLRETRQSVQWRSTNPSAATVDSNGRVHAVSAGYTCIIATVGGNEYFVDVQVITDLEQRISAIQNKYPAGYFWNSGPPSANFPHVSEVPCNHRENVRMCIGQCAGYAHLISNEVFGTNAPRVSVANVGSVRQGDYVRYSNRPGHNHSVFVIRVIREGEIVGFDRRTREHIRANSLSWLVTHCNWMMDCGILWYHRYDPAARVQTFNSSESYSRG
jgi:hypothetical protein